MIIVMNANILQSKVRGAITKKRGKKLGALRLHTTGNFEGKAKQHKGKATQCSTHGKSLVVKCSAQGSMKLSGTKMKREL